MVCVRSEVFGPFSRQIMFAGLAGVFVRPTRSAAVVSAKGLSFSPAPSVGLHVLCVAAVSVARFLTLLGIACT